MGVGNSAVQAILAGLSQLTYDQLAIMLLSGASIALFSTKRFFWFGFVCGLCGQPFWIYTAIVKGQPGILVVSLWYTVFHIRGIWNHWRGR